MSQLVDIYQEIFTLLKQKEEIFEKIKNAEGSLIEKWQRFLTVMLPMQMAILRRYDYPCNQKGLADFQKQVSASIETDANLKKVHEEMWLYLLGKTFGVTKLEELSLDKVRTIIKDLTSALTDPSLLEKMETVTREMKGKSVDEQKNRFFDVLFPIQVEVIERHGLQGEEGFIQVQRAIVEYLFDPEVLEEVKKTEEAIQEKTRISNR